LNTNEGPTVNHEDFVPICFEFESFETSACEHNIVTLLFLKILNETAIEEIILLLFYLQGHAVDIRVRLKSVDHAIADAFYVVSFQPSINLFIGE
jgi:hypothetical protein